MKRIFYFLPLAILCLVSFKPLVKNRQDTTPSIIFTGCFTHQSVYVEVDYNTGTFSVTQVRVYSNSYPYTQYTVTGYTYDDAWYYGGHVYVTFFTVEYSIPGGGSGYAYPPSSMLDNDCG